MSFSLQASATPHIYRSVPCFLGDVFHAWIRDGRVDLDGCFAGGISHDSLLSIGYRRNKGLRNDGFYRHRTFTYIIRLGSVARLFFLNIGWGEHLHGCITDAVNLLPH